MKLEMAASLAAAVLLHALLLFGFRLGTSARPLAMSDDSAPVDVSLVDAAPEPEAAAAPSATPQPPEPTPAPTPPEPQPTPDMPTPPPEATPEQEEMSVPSPARPRASPHHVPQKRAAASTAPPAPGGHGLAPAKGAAGRAAANGPPNSRARYRSNPRPDYPEEARQKREEGVVLVNVEVGADGRANDVTLAAGSGFPLLDSAALQAVRRWTFEPAEAGGLPVPSRVEVPVRFSLSR